MVDLRKKHRFNRWFSRYLYGIDNGVEDDPRAWIVREGEKRDNPTPYADYPNPDASPVTLHLTAGGGRIGGLSTKAAGNQGSEQLVDTSGKARLEYCGPLDTVALACCRCSLVGR